MKFRFVLAPLLLVVFSFLSHALGPSVIVTSQAAASCAGTPWGTVPSGYSNTAYSSSTPAAACTTIQQTRVCTNGVMSGSFTNTSCTDGCTGTPFGNVSTGYSNTAYSSSAPATSCASNSETRTCTAGTMSGSFANATCSEPCTGTIFGTMTSGSSNTAYSSATPAGPCTGGNAQTRTCTNGSLSGTFTNTSCTAGCAAQTVNWSQTTHNCTGTSVALTNTGTSTVTDAVNWDTGTVNITCNAGTLNQSSANCASSCGGTLATTVAGTGCFYTSAINGDCDTTCTGHGGADSVLTCNTFASYCSQIVNILFPGLTDGGLVGGIDNCYYFPSAGGSFYRAQSGSCTTAAVTGGYARVCACNN